MIECVMLDTLPEKANLILNICGIGIIRCQ